MIIKQKCTTLEKNGVHFLNYGLYLNRETIHRRSWLGYFLSFLGRLSIANSQH